MVTKLKNLLNSLRNLLLFRVFYPWVRYGKNVHVQWSACFASPYRNISIGNNVGIGPHCVIMSDLIIGNDVLIAPHVALLSRYPHRTDLVGTSMFQGPRADRGEIVIEEDVWIGFGAIIFSGVRIGRGSIIAAGSVVLKDVPRYSILLPKQDNIIKPRFNSQQIHIHEAGLERAGVIPHQANELVASGRAFMRTILVAVASGIAGILGSAWLASAQSPIMLRPASRTAGQLHKVPSPSQSQTYAPSDISVTSTGMPVDGRPRLRSNQLAAQSGMGKPAAGSAPLIPHLCFQPGIGWTATPSTATPDSDIKSISEEGNGAGANQPLQTRSSVFSAQRALKTGECPPMPQLQDLANATAESPDSTSFGTNPLLPLDGGMTSSGSYQVLMGISPDAESGNAARVMSALNVSEGATNQSNGKEADPEAALEELKALRRRTYVSPVKLRRLSRNVQDMETRLELRRVNEEVQKHDARSTDEKRETNTDAETTTNHKTFNSLGAARAECARRSAASKPKFCSQLER